jgi:hypothetical protein
MNKVISYQEEVWMREVKNAEDEVRRRVPTPPGGQIAGESVDAYAARCTGYLTTALDRLAMARAELARVQAPPFMTVTTTARPKRKQQFSGGNSEPKS